MRRRGRRDRNHSPVVALYRQLGCGVLDLGNVGSGCPDICVAVAGGFSDLVEIKSEDGTLTADQQKFIAAWPVEVVIIRTLEDVVIHVGNMRKRAYR